MSLTDLFAMELSRSHHMSADLGLDALGGAGNLITDTVSLGLNSLDRLLGGLATRRLQIGKQPLPALWAMNRFQEVDENATDGSGTDKLGQADRRPASIESLRPVTAAYRLGHAASQWPGGLSRLCGGPTSLHRAAPVLLQVREQALTSLLAPLGMEEVDDEAAQRGTYG